MVANAAPKVGMALERALQSAKQPVERGTRCRRWGRYTEMRVKVPSGVWSGSPGEVGSRFAELVPMG